MRRILHWRPCATVPGHWSATVTGAPLASHSATRAHACGATAGERTHTRTAAQFEPHTRAGMRPMPCTVLRSVLVQRRTHVRAAARSGHRAWRRKAAAARPYSTTSSASWSARIPIPRAFGLRTQCADACVSIVLLLFCTAGLAEPRGDILHRCAHGADASAAECISCNVHFISGDRLVPPTCLPSPNAARLSVRTATWHMHDTMTLEWQASLAQPQCVCERHCALTTHICP